MQVINKRIIVIFICLFIFSFGLYKLLDKKEIELDSVILDTQKQDNTFAIYLEESKDNYKEDKLIPEDGYIFNEEKSQCMNIDGNIIENILSYDYDNKKLIVDTTESISCYLYFDKGAGLEIIGKEPKPNGLNLETTSSSDEWTGMYRFQGQQSEEIENYICFGTSDSSECTKSPDKYMYRIIGIEESGRIKVIKKEALEDAEQWWTDNDTPTYWNESLAFKNINGEKFLNKEEYVPKGWEEKIDNNNWLFGSMSTANTNFGANQSGVNLYKTESGQKAAAWNEKSEKDEVYKGTKATSFVATKGDYIGREFYYITPVEKWTETSFPHEVNAKISLMYLSDYYLAVSNETNCQYDSHKYEKCVTSWINLLQNDTNPPANGNELTMTNYGFQLEYALLHASNISYVGYSNITYFSTPNDVRPVFYLKANNILKEGLGTQENPFILI